MTPYSEKPGYDPATIWITLERLRRDRPALINETDDDLPLWLRKIEGEA